MSRHVWVQIARLAVGFLAVMTALGAFGALIAGSWGAALALGAVFAASLAGLWALGVRMPRRDDG